MWIQDVIVESELMVIIDVPQSSKASYAGFGLLVQDIKAQKISRGRIGMYF